MSRQTNTIKPFNTKRSIQKAEGANPQIGEWTLFSGDKVYIWTNKMERVEIIREGIPYDSIEVISRRLNRPIKYVLNLVGIAQTTYNKKKGQGSLLEPRDSELIVLITELLDYGIQVFNNEEDKFQRWLKKPNLSLGGASPESLLDTITGIDEVKFCLNRLEYGNLA